MYQISYNQIVAESSDALRMQEREAMDRGIAMLRVAQNSPQTAGERYEALYYLKRLWSIFVDDLGGPDNELPDEVRAGLISIGIWISKEIQRLETGASTDLRGLIEINEIIRDALL